jgi:hypothetical protein
VHGDKNNTPAKPEPKPIKSILGSIIGKVSGNSKPKENTPPHIIVKAGAGCGKTTSLIEGLKVLRGEQPSIIPSTQQQRLWDALCLSPADSSVCFVAFGKDIAEELRTRVPKGVTASTLHAAGYRLLRKHGNYLIHEYATEDMVAKIMGKEPKIVKRDSFLGPILRATVEIVVKCKMHLLVGSPEELDFILSHHDIEVADWHKEHIYNLVPRTLEGCKTPTGNRIDFEDQIWLPIVLGLSPYKFDILMGDEVQDWNRAQQMFAKMLGRRLVLIGDPDQAIYGFAGADSEGMERLERELSLQHYPPQSELGNGIRVEGPGCLVLPLNVTRRCGHAIVKEANKIVPDLVAHESNPKGSVKVASYPVKKLPDGRTIDVKPNYCDLVCPGDMVLCRTNAPLVGEYFRYLAEGRKAYVQGKDIGRGIIKLVKTLTVRPNTKGSDMQPLLNQKVATLIAALDDWLATETSKENAKERPSEGKLILLRDKRDCVLVFCDAPTVDEVINDIEAVFLDTGEGIRMSSIHKAKGLEARRVFLLEPFGCTVPHPMARSAWQKEQEMHLRYVAITRAIEELYYVS